MQEVVLIPDWVRLGGLIFLSALVIAGAVTAWSRRRS